MPCFEFFPSAVISVLLLTRTKFGRLVLGRVKASGFGCFLVELDRGLVNSKPLVLDDIVESCLLGLGSTSLRFSFNRRQCDVYLRSKRALLGLVFFASSEFSFSFLPSSLNGLVAHCMIASLLRLATLVSVFKSSCQCFVMFQFFGKTNLSAINSTYNCYNKLHFLAEIDKKQQRYKSCPFTERTTPKKFILTSTRQALRSVWI